jgi:hypothetical protein
LRCSCWSREESLIGARIEVRNAMSVVGRGAVLIGYLREGSARAGQVTRPLSLGPGPDRRLEVAVVQRLTSMEAGSDAVGLVFRNAPGLAELQRALPAGSMLSLEEPPEGGDR